MYCNFDSSTWPNLCGMLIPNVNTQWPESVLKFWLKHCCLVISGIIGITAIDLSNEMTILRLLFRFIYLCDTIKMKLFEDHVHFTVELRHNKLKTYNTQHQPE